jgi:hypothetical protein
VTTALDDTGALTLVSSTELRERLLRAEVELRQAYSRMLGVVGEVENRRLAQSAGFRDSAALLSRLLRISTGEARERVEHAGALAPRRSATGAPLPELLPAAAAALDAGELGTGQLRVITTTMTLLGPQVSAEQREHAETDLVEHARTFEPRRLTILARRIRDHLDPDGPAPDDSQPMAGACGELRLRHRGDGGLSLEGWLDVEAGAQLRDLIDRLSAPRPATENIPDQRDTAQRQADALAEMCALAGGARDAPGHGGERPHLNVTLALDTLRSAVKAAVLDYGHELTVTQARRLACDCKIIPVVLGGPSEPLDVGRFRRTAPLGLRRAVTIRDRGCAFPGCDRRPRQCDVHHVIHWADGGETCLENCCLLCSRHHREVHETGWEITIYPDRVEFIPPGILDPLRKPLTNPYWHRPESASA